jgi:hypothetical protein
MCNLTPANGLEPPVPNLEHASMPILAAATAGSSGFSTGLLSPDSAESGASETILGAVDEELQRSLNPCRELWHLDLPPRPPRPRLSQMLPTQRKKTRWVKGNRASSHWAEHANFGSCYCRIVWLFDRKPPENVQLDPGERPGAPSTEPGTRFQSAGFQAETG